MREIAVSNDRRKKYRDRASRAAREIEKEQSAQGYIRDGSGRRYRVGVFFLLAGDLEKAEASFDWFYREFPDDVGEPIFNLYSALSAYRTGRLREARIRLLGTMVSNIFLLPRIVGQNISVQGVSHPSNRQQESYLDGVEEFLHEPNDEECSWIASELNSEDFTALRDGYVSTYGLLNGEHDFAKQMGIIAEWRTLQADRFEKIGSELHKETTVTWEADLIGDAFDLGELELATRSRDPTIVKVGDGYGLRYSKFDTCESHKEVEDIAVEATELLTGMCKVLLSSRSAIGVSGITRYMPNGSRQMFNTLQDTLHVRASMSMIITNSDGSVTEAHQADPVVRWLSLAYESEHVAKVFRLLSDPQMSWGTLYKIYEVIEHEVGGAKKIADMGWASSTAIGRFRHSANSPSVGGDNARHGIESTAPPSKPMDFAEARAMVQMLMHGWLGHQA